MISETPNQHLKKYKLAKVNDDVKGASKWGVIFHTDSDSCARGLGARPDLLTFSATVGVDSPYQNELRNSM